jgi:F-type H+-transporting ATPase subunit alpha
MDEDTRQTLARGRRVREILKQPQYQPLSVPEQIAALLAANEGLLDDVPLDDIAAAAEAIRDAVVSDLSDLCETLVSGGDLGDDAQKALVEKAREAIRDGGFMGEPSASPEDEGKNGDEAKDEEGA